MNWLIAAWAIMIGICFALGLASFAVWMRRRDSANFRHLLIAVLAFAVSTFGYVEVRLMTLQSVNEVFPFLRLGHSLIFAIYLAMAIFVHVHFGTGRFWLICVVFASRAAVLVADYSSAVNVNYLAVRSLRTVPLLGEYASVIGEAVPNPWSVLVPLGKYPPAKPGALSL